MAKDDKAVEAALSAAQPMIEWANSVPRGDLAVEVMAVFLNGERYSTREIAKQLFRLPSPGYSGWSGYPRNYISALQKLEIPVHEALQLLEHAELIYGYVDDGTSFWGWRATQLGVATSANGKAAVRQRVKERTGL